jgi:pimeloyl-ACP methyl ester carboxylesterase
MVITEAAVTAGNVTGLIYVAAFIPELGESVTSINARYPATSAAPTLDRIPAAAGEAGSQVELLIPQELYPAAFAGDLPVEAARLSAAIQRPPTLACLEQPATRTAWRELPSWAVVATADQMIHPQAQSDMAQRAGSAVVSVDASHAVSLSRPSVVTDAIRRALRVTVPA